MLTSASQGSWNGYLVCPFMPTHFDSHLTEDDNQISTPSAAFRFLQMSLLVETLILSGPCLPYHPEV